MVAALFDQNRMLFKNPICRFKMSVETYLPITNDLLLGFFQVSTLNTCDFIDDRNLFFRQHPYNSTTYPMATYP